ncbi:MAG: DUF1015 domain-containing protein [Planctomycetes bacterium]|nr:DUF1015 domain-containing protein [Planctomycetota bacterium]
MADVAPFRAVRYDFDRLHGDLSAVLAPPYDVLDAKDKDALLRRNEQNIVAVDLPHVPPKSAGPPAAYERSAQLISQWLDAGVLVREAAPALYPYHQRFTHGGHSFTRRMVIARLRLQPFSDGVILPHEQTFGGPKEDRLALMKATRCNLSPIFGLYRDPQDRIGALFAAAVADKPAATGVLDDVENRIWIVRDAGTIGGVVQALSTQKVYIADGHHRYGTALMYRDWLRKQSVDGLGDDHPSNYVMFVLASMDDPGCLILPYHRALADVALSTVQAAWAPGVEEVPPDKADLLLEDGRTGKRASLRFTNRPALASLEPNESPAWQALDTAYLHRYLIDGLLREKLSADPKVRYAKSEEDARRTAREQAGVALLLKPTPMEHLRAVSEAGGLMPQKSTYFHPKLATGLTIHPLD